MWDINSELRGEKIEFAKYKLAIERKKLNLYSVAETKTKLLNIHFEILIKSDLWELELQLP